MAGLQFKTDSITNPRNATSRDLHMIIHDLRMVRDYCIAQQKMIELLSESTKKTAIQQAISTSSNNDAIKSLQKGLQSFLLEYDKHERIEDANVKSFEATVRKQLEQLEGTLSRLDRQIRIVKEIPEIEKRGFFTSIADFFKRIFRIKR